MTYPSLLAFPGYVVVAWLLRGGLDPVARLIGSLAVRGCAVRRRVISRGMGMGDVKLAPCIGVVLGSLGLRFVGVAAAGAVLFGGVGGIVALSPGATARATIPFGPYMAAGAVVAAFWGEPIAEWYLALHCHGSVVAFRAENRSNTRSGHFGRCLT